MNGREKTLILTAIGLFGLLLFATACQKAEPDPEEISNSLEITYRMGPELRPPGDIEVKIVNKGTACIYFPIDFGLKISVVDNGTKTELKNNATYSGLGQWKLAAWDGPNRDIVVGFSPDLSGITIKEPLDGTAELNGTLCDDPTVVIKKEIPFTVIP